MRLKHLLLTYLLLALAPVTGCEVGEIGDVGAVGDVGDDEPLDGIDEDDGIIFSTALAVGQKARVCRTNGAGLRQRSGPGTGYRILRVMPGGTTVTVKARSGSWFRVSWGGRLGWSHGAYLCQVSGASPSPGFDQPKTRDGATRIGWAARGFSYYWGGGAFKKGGSKGACYGSCPSCSHSGRYGADCSGFVSKAWQLSAALPMASNRHPYSTYNFYNQQTHWRRKSRSNLKRSDALVYRSGGAGHIALYRTGNPWGRLYAFECRGCSYGCVHNLRSFGSAYRAIKRNGW